MKVIGIDPSTKATGLVVLRAANTKIPELLFEESAQFPKFDGMARYQKIVTRVMEVIHTFNPDRIVVEGYSLNLKNASSVVPLVELGGLLRFMLWIDGFKWLDPKASELKKFAVGKGNGDKSQVQMYVHHRWQHLSATNDTADAYVLACMGLAHAGLLPGITQEMRALAGKLTFKTC